MSLNFQLSAFSWRNSLLPICALVGYWALLIYQLGAQWSAYEQYNYGWAVPFLCAYLLWKRIQDAETCPSPVARRVPPAALWSVLVLFASVWLPVRWLHEANPIWRLTSWVLALEIVAITLLAVRLASGDSRWKQFTFPICFFLIAVPWPSVIEALVTQSLMQANVSVTTELLAIMGIPALQRGNVIEIASGLVGVDEACSGIRSFQATLMISLFLGELYRLSIFRRLSLCLAGFALSFGFNIGRTFLLVYVASRDGIKAIAKWHDPAGIIILVGCFLGLWLVALCLRKPGFGVHALACSPSSNTTPGSAGVPPAPVGVSPTMPIATPSPHWGEGRGEVLFETPSSLLPNPNPRDSAFQHFRLLTLNRVPLFLIAWFLFTEIAVECWYRSHEALTNETPAWTVKWPVQNPTFKSVKISNALKIWLAFDEGGQGAWTEADGTLWQMIYFHWLPSRSLYARVRCQLNQTHRPEHCLVGAGMKLVGDLGVGDYRCGNVKFALKKLLFETDGTLLRVFYAQYEDSANPGFIVSYRENISQRIAAACSGSRNFGLRSLEIAVSGNLGQRQAEEGIQRLLQTLIEIEPTGRP